MATFILDSSALIAYARDEPGAELVESLVLDSQHVCVAHAINMCEFYYDSVRRSDEQAAQQMIADLLSLGVGINSSLSTKLWQAAGRLKATYRRISLADCFGLALAQRVQATFVTTDHHELDALVAAGMTNILFIR